jgi:hypothetical protein
MFENLISNLMGFLLVIILACVTTVVVIGTAAICCKIYQEINKPAISAEAE